VDLFRATVAEKTGVELGSRLTTIFHSTELYWKLDQDSLEFAQSFSENLWAAEKDIPLDGDKGLDQKHDTSQILELYYTICEVENDFTWFEIYSIWVSEFVKLPGASRYTWHLKPSGIRSVHPEMSRDAHITALKKSGDVILRLMAWKAFYEAYLKDPRSVLSAISD
tara:strand:- start:2657 stop:3157 length:501 start_codon:yes stop_codon:yes gene_type:complete